MALRDSQHPPASKTNPGGLPLCARAYSIHNQGMLSHEGAFHLQQSSDVSCTVTSPTYTKDRRPGASALSLTHPSFSAHNYNAQCQFSARGQPESKHLENNFDTVETQTGHWELVLGCHL